MTDAFFVWKCEMQRSFSEYTTRGTKCDESLHEITAENLVCVLSMHGNFIEFLESVEKEKGLDSPIK